MTVILKEKISVPKGAEIFCPSSGATAGGESEAAQGFVVLRTLFLDAALKTRSVCGKID